MKASLALLFIAYVYTVYGLIHVPLQRRKKTQFHFENFVDETNLFGSIFIGTPPQLIEVTFDTGSANLFVPGLNCDGANGENIFNQTASSTFESLQANVSNSFLKGGYAGVLGQDTVSIGGLNIKQLAFVYASSMSGFGGGYPSGTLGLAYPQVANYYQPTLMEQLVQDGLTEDTSFSLYLTDNTSTMVFGGVDPKFAKSEFKYFPIIGDGFYGSIAKLTIGDFVMADNIEATFDTGTSDIYIDEYLFHIFLEKSGIDPNAFYDSIDDFPTITIHIGNGTLELKPEAYMIYMSLFKQYYLGMYGHIEGSHEILLGDLFLRSYYTHFDYMNMRVGFAEPAPYNSTI